MAEKRTARPSRRSTDPNRSGSTRLRRECQRLAVAVLLFGLCFAGKTLFPQRAEQGAALVRQVLTSSSDFETAFADLGEDLSQGKGVAESVGSWCVTVFAPQEVTESPPEGETEETAGTETASGAETPWWEQLLSSLLARLSAP